MASTQATVAVNRIAGEDLRTSNSRGIYSALTTENDGGVAKLIAAVLATDVIVGVLAEEPRQDATTDGENVPVVLVGAGGITCMRAEGAITAGELIVPTTTPGRVTGVANIAALAANQMAVGIAQVSAVAGDIFDVLLMPISGPTA